MGRLKKWLAIVLVVPSVVLFAGVTGFVAWTEWMHGESRCPYHPMSTETLTGGVRVVEESRRCVSGLQERRWVLLKGSVGRRVLGTQRLKQVEFQRDRGYRWECGESERGVRVQVTHPNAASVEFFERPPPGGRRSR